MLRHAVATMIYRGAKTVRDAPLEFREFRIQPTSRTPMEILAHLGDLFAWSLSMAEGQEAWHSSPAEGWERELARFYDSVEKFDAYLAGASPVACPMDRLFQGPIADALTHVGQLAMLRSLFGVPIQGENYFRADIRIGQVGPDQPPPKKLFTR
jgi:hypothetical protein